MTLNGAIKQLHDLRCAKDMPIYYKPAIAEVINVLLMDTQEVKHGRWECEIRNSIDSLHTYQQFRCSVCGMTYITNTPYCPNCGAKMSIEKGETHD